MNAYSLIALVLWPLVGGCQSPPAIVSEASQPLTEHLAIAVPLAQQLDSLALTGRDLRFRVDKSERKFDVLVGEQLLRTYPCVLGEVPEGDKMMQGDRRTPEGEFGIRSKRMHDKWHAFVWVDYPNAESRKRFAERKRTGAIPANADIGGEIGIHGVPEGMDHWIEMGQDWTWGCIALRNADLDEIYPYIAAGRTTITIEP